MVYHQMIGRGGLEKYVLGLAGAMSGRGHEVRLVTARTDEVAERLGLEVTRVGLAGVPKWARLWVFARKMARERGRESEVVLGFGRTWKQDIHRAGGGCHALYSELLPWWRRWGLRNQVELALERRLYGGGETRWYVVNASPVAGQLARRYGVPTDRLVVIHTAVDTGRFSPGPQVDGSPRDLRTPGSPPVFLFISSNHRRKGLPALVKALASVPTAHLWVVGAGLSGPDRRLVQRVGVSERVRAWGEVEDLVPLYREADWFIHPTLYDACANTVLQSMACGLPGLVSVADGASEFVRDGENGYLLRDPGSPSCLEDAMNHALALDPQTRARMGRAARATVLPLTWEAHVAAWETLCQRVIDERSEVGVKSS